MRPAALLAIVNLLAPFPASAALLAHVNTTLGPITVELQFEKAPLAVANFITLAEGTRPHVDPTTGALSFDPYYVGEKFFRVIDDPTFKIAQTGSGTGTNSGGPGYTFPDEFDPTLTHVPYVLSMANSGPNTNGSQIFFVGNSTPSHLNNVHTVFGLVTDLPSRAVIDAIHTAGSNGSSISGITFERTGPAALAFDESAQALPMLSSPAPELSIVPGTSVTLTPSSPFSEGSQLSVFRSPDLISWTAGDPQFVGFDNAPLSELLLDSTGAEKAFYHLARIDSPNSIAPGSIANRTLTFVVGATTLTYSFNATATGGTGHLSNDNSTGSITYLTHDLSAYSATIVVQSTNIVPVLIRIAYDSETPTLITGRGTIATWNGISWNASSPGTYTLTK